MDEVDVRPVLSGFLNRAGCDFSSQFGYDAKRRKGTLFFAWE